MNLVLGYVHPGWVTWEFCRGLVELARHERGVTIIQKRSGPMISEARNAIFDVARRMELPLLFVDTDSAFTLDDIQALLDTGEQIISANIDVQHENGRRSPAGHQLDENGLYRPLQPGDLRNRRGPVNVAAVGMGCTLIRPPVLEALEPGPLFPFAETIHTSAWAKQQPIGEDVTFCKRAREVGFRSFIEPNVKVGHVKSRVVL